MQDPGRDCNDQRIDCSGGPAGQGHADDGVRCRIELWSRQEHDRPAAGLLMPDDGIEVSPNDIAS